MDEVRIELAPRLGEGPPGTGRHGRLVDEFMYIGQDANPGLLRRETDSLGSIRP
ncbi:hypothetical protein [Kribbella sp. NPDC000426]|uniref:hypothetical protein n=1 Tax=Kribbella sp. NPDC000426 TaxID=3154255 RepID=UPI00331C9BBC